MADRRSATLFATYSAGCPTMSRSCSSVVISRRMTVPLLALQGPARPRVCIFVRLRGVSGAKPHARATSRRLDADLGRRLVGSQAAPTRMAQPPVAGPLPEADLTHQFRLHECHCFGGLAGKWFIER